MKIFQKAFIAVCFIVTTVAAAAQGKVTVNISGLKSDKGVCRVCLFDNAAAFNGAGNPVQCQVVTVNNKHAVAQFDNIASGNYAISVFHDANNNNKLDVNFIGIPKEGYGASKNKLPFASAPAFKENQFVIKTGSHLHLPIRLRHL